MTQLQAIPAGDVPGDSPSLWPLDPTITYLNHGSFGPAPLPVRMAQREWMDRLQANPMDFYVRKLEEYLDEARAALGKFVGAPANHLLFVDNATVGMNIIARSLPLQPGDEVLANDHEYGAVLRIWRARCQEAGAQLIVARLRDRIHSEADIVDTLQAAITPRTRLIVVSHVTSPTAIIFPVAALGRMARDRGIPIAIDGPHAPAVVDLKLQELGCDFYSASCHKWLSAPLGSGFLYVHPRWQSKLQPLVVSWGASLSGRTTHWHDNYNWLGTRDYAAFLSIPAAIRFLEELPPADNDQPGAPSDQTATPPAPRGVDRFRQQTHALAHYAREKLVAWTGLEPIIPDSPAGYGSMIACPLPAVVGPTEGGHMHPLQRALWERHRIEVPIVNWRDQRWIRVSAHLYNTRQQIDQLLDALPDCLGSP